MLVQHRMVRGEELGLMTSLYLYTQMGEGEGGLSSNFMFNLALVDSIIIDQGINYLYLMWLSQYAV